MLNNEETLKNLRIETRNSIVNTYREITLLYLLSTKISYRFKTIIEFSLVFAIRNTILKRIS